MQKLGQQRLTMKLGHQGNATAKESSEILRKKYTLISFRHQELIMVEVKLFN